MFVNNSIVSVLVVVLLSSIAVSNAARTPYAQGNLAVVLNVSNAIVQPHNTLRGEFSQHSLWCQATEDGETPLDLQKATFQRTYHPHQHDAQIENQNRAFFKFGSPTTRDIGKYKCDMITADGRRAWGNLFVYMRPVFHTNGSVKLDIEDDDDPYTVTASSVKYNEQDTAVLNCPVISYPQADIQWFKNGKPVDSDNGRISKRDPNLYIERVTKVDEGKYTCRATNRFPIQGDNEVEFSSDLEQHLRINGTLGWITPLIIIIVTLLLLFCIIYSCAAYKKRKQNQYNVAKREKTLRMEEERLNADIVEVEEE